MSKIIQTILLSLIYVLFSTATANELPDLGDASQTILSIKAQQKLTHEYLRQLRAAVNFVTDPYANDYIQSLGNRLAAKAQSKQTNFHFFIIESPEINAFAGPGGYLGINSGLILAARSESELAAVMAHEIAHETQFHIYRGIERSKQLSWPMIAGGIVTALLSAVQPQLAGGILIAGIAGAQQARINFIRSNEKEADRIGMNILAASGYDPRSMANFFQRLQQEMRYYSNNIPAILRTHPVTEDRIAEAQNRLSHTQQTHYKKNPRFHLLQARIQVDTAHNPQKLLKHYQTSFKKHTNNPVIRYGYALAQLKAHHFDEAENTITPLTTNHPDEIFFQSSLADIQYQQHDFAAAQVILEKLLAIYPHHYPIILQYSQVLLAANKPKLAITLLRDSLIEHPDQPQLYQLLARAQAQAGQTAEAHLSNANAYALMGDDARAIQQIKTGLKQKNLNRYLTARLQAKLDELQTLSSRGLTAGSRK